MPLRDRLLVHAQVLQPRVSAAAEPALDPAPHELVRVVAADAQELGRSQHVRLEQHIDREPLDVKRDLGSLHDHDEVACW